MRSSRSRLMSHAGTQLKRPSAAESVAGRRMPAPPRALPLRWDRLARWHWAWRPSPPSSSSAHVLAHPHHARRRRGRAQHADRARAARPQRQRRRSRSWSPTIARSANTCRRAAARDFDAHHRRRRCARDAVAAYFETAAPARRPRDCAAAGADSRVTSSRGASSRSSARSARSGWSAPRGAGPRLAAHHVRRRLGPCHQRHPGRCDAARLRSWQSAINAVRGNVANGRVIAQREQEFESLLGRAHRGVAALARQGLAGPACGRTSRRPCGCACDREVRRARAAASGATFSRRARRSSRACRSSCREPARRGLLQRRAARGSRRRGGASAR